MNSPSARRIPALAFLIVLSGMAAVAQTPARTSIVRVAFVGDACASPLGASPCVVLIEADGPLPQPSGGALTNPDRIYLDFPGTQAETAGVPRSDASRPRVRVAVHSDAPLVARVVIDLAAPASYTLDLSHRAEGQVRLQLRAAARAASSPPSDVRLTSTPRGTPATGGRRSARTYEERIKDIVDALERMRADLALLDRRSMPATDSLQTNTLQLAAARDALASAKPPASLASAHGNLVSACSLAAMAFDAAARNRGGQVTPETASAAAGALILLDRARAALATGR